MWWEVVCGDSCVVGVMGCDVVGVVFGGCGGTWCVVGVVGCGVWWEWWVVGCGVRHGDFVWVHVARCFQPHIATHAPCNHSAICLAK